MQATRGMRFHWSLPANGVNDRRRGGVNRNELNPIEDLDGQRLFCQRAEELGFDSLLLPIGFQRADPSIEAAVFGMATERIKFMTASRPTVISPTHFVQQVNTVSAFTNGRISINVVSGQGSAELRYYGDFSDHDERYQITDEFWTICHALWRREFPFNFEGRFLKVADARVNQEFVSPDSNRPFVYIGGSSELARQIAIKHGDCSLRLIEPPNELAPKIEPILESGTECGLICNLLAAPTHDEAVELATSLIEGAGEVGKAAVAQWRSVTTESQGFSKMFELAERDNWLTPYLWSGLVPYLGPMSISMIGGVDEIVEAVFEYRRIGITQFLFQGRPDLPMLNLFGTQILPKIREREALEPAMASGAREGH